MISSSGQVSKGDLKKEINKDFKRILKLVTQKKAQAHAKLDSKRCIEGWGSRSLIKTGYQKSNIEEVNLDVVSAKIGRVFR